MKTNDDWLAELVREKYKAYRLLNEFPSTGNVVAVDIKPESDVIHDRIDQIIKDLSGNRVAPRKVDELGDAVGKAKKDRGIFGAINKR